MKMRVWNLLFAGLFLILIFPFVFASEHVLTDQEKVDEAYQCLNDKVVGNCDSLSLGEKTFSLLAINKCNSELISDSEIVGSEERCWPSGNCGVKETAQAVIALDNSGSNTDDARDWLLNQNAIPGDIEWFLQIDALNASTCSLKYSSASYSVDILETDSQNPPTQHLLESSVTIVFPLQISPEEQISPPLSKHVSKTFCVLQHLNNPGHEYSFSKLPWQLAPDIQ